MQVTFEKIAILDPVFDTLDSVGTFDEVGDPPPVEETLGVRMYASIRGINVYLSLHIYMNQTVYVCIQYIEMCV